MLISCKKKKKQQKTLLSSHKRNVSVFCCKYLLGEKSREMWKSRRESTLVDFGWCANAFSPKCCIFSNAAETSRRNVWVKEPSRLQTLVASYYCKVREKKKSAGCPAEKLENLAARKSWLQFPFAVLHLFLGDITHSALLHEHIYVLNL